MKVPQGKYIIWISGTKRHAKSQPESLRIVFEHCAKNKPDLIPYLASFARRKTKLIAKTPTELNPDRPELSQRCTRVFGEYWIYNTRSGDKVLRLMEMACKYAGLKFMEDVKVDPGMFNDPHYAPGKLEQIPV